MVKQDTGKYRENIKDQFYTKESVAKKCIDTIIKKCPYTKRYLWIEPSAGNGSFLHNVPKHFDKIGVDLYPAANDIHKANFLKWKPPSTDQNIILFGNPPFGRQSSLAKAFIAKGCQFADIIAFILPKSFLKPSMSRIFDKKFHCIYSVELDKNSFLINESIPYDVPCVFQIWEKSTLDRKTIKPVHEKGFQYVKSSDKYDLVFRRIGGRAGQSYKKNKHKSFNPQSHYFIKLDTPYVKHIDTIVKKINSHVFPSNTVGPRSLSKPETNIVINRILSKLAAS
jgi:hypothetical protein